MRLSSFQRGFLSVVTAALMMIPGGLDSGISAQAKGTTPRLAPLQSVSPKHVVQVQSTLKPESSTASHPKAPMIPNILLGTKGQSALWLNEALAALHYLPVEFTPNEGTPSSVAAGDVGASTSAPSDDGSSASSNPSQPVNGSNPTTPTTLTAQLALALRNNSLTPMSGQWTWNTSYPASLKKLWDPATTTVITQGAVMSFQHVHGLDVDGIAGPDVYSALAKALTLNQTNPNPYIYVTVSKTGSERLNVWLGARVIYTTLANTGISAAQTPNGTWPIYLRLKSQTMQGKTPTGQTYSDPGVPWINYFYQGCAIHGYPRASYGSPQSLGCVELPITAAANVYNLLDYGTLVTVSP